MTDTLPTLDTQTDAFLRNPNAMLGSGADRLKTSRGAMGVEFHTYATARELFRTPAVRPRDIAYFVDRGASRPVLDYVASGMLTVMPPESHDRVKRVLAKGFTAPRIQAFSDTVRGIADDLIDRAGGGGTMNFVSDWSHHYTIASVARFIGAEPEDIARIEKFTVNFRMLGQVPIGPGLPVLEQTIAEVSAFATDVLADRRRARRQDLISDMIEAQEEGEKLTEPELLWATTNLLNAGHDTTRFQVAACVRLLIEMDAWDRVRAEPELASRVVTEAMRMFPATPRQIRVPLEPVCFDGTDFAPGGEVMVINMASAGRDPAEFPDPDTPSLDRERQWDLGFGLARHFCLGQALARTEMVQAIQSLVEAWEPPTFAGDLEYKATGVIAGVEVMPIRFRRR
jgi:cytochrome P450